MTPTSKSRTSTENAINEEILHKCNQIYTDKEQGLVKIGELLGLKLVPPKKKIVVLLIGNHSSGKSSFINWYIEDEIQKTGVAIETQGFTIVTSGKRRETLGGEATTFLYPHFRKLKLIADTFKFLSTEISTSKKRKFQMVSFVDTPGLVDAAKYYPYDVDKAILLLGSVADIILVFFDPIGQALCSRTLNLVEKLGSIHSEKMRFYLSKADEAGPEKDRQRVMMQIAVELCRQPGINKQAFKMETIFIPDKAKDSNCVNEIDEVCRDIEKVVNDTVQLSLNNLKKDCHSVLEALNTSVKSAETLLSKKKKKLVWYGVLCLVMAQLSRLSLLTAKREVNRFSWLISEPITPEEVDPFWTIILFFIATGIFGILAVRNIPFSCVFDRSTRKNFKEHIENIVIPEEKRMYVKYVEQSISNFDSDGFHGSGTT